MNTYEIPANQFIEAQTVEIEKEFHRSRPEPRNWAMGFYGRDEDDFRARAVRKKRAEAQAVRKLQ